MDENQVGAAEPPWFQSTLLWGSVSTVIAIVLAVLAAALKDLRWLLFIAWPLAIIAVREFSRTRHSPKPRYWVVGGAIISAIILLSLYHFLGPSSLNEYGSRIVVTRGSTERPDNDHILYKFWLTNKGQLAAKQPANTTSLTYSNRVLSSIEEDGLFSKMLMEAKSENLSSQNEVQPGDQLETKEMPFGLSQIEYSNILDGKSYLYFALISIYTDSLLENDKEKVTEFCVYITVVFQPSNKCIGHNRVYVTTK